MPTLKILMVTREQAADRLYGLGKSLEPLCAALRTRGHEIRYLSQADAEPDDIAARHRLYQILSRPWGKAGNPLFAGAFAERLNMGRMAARLAASESYTHVHLHDPWIALGFRWFSRYYRAGKSHWGVTEHGYGCYSHATLQDGLTQGIGLQRWLRRLEGSLLARADWCVFPTQAALVQTARDLCFAEVPGGWRVIPHARPPLGLRPRDTARQLLGWDHSRRYVLTVGRLVPLKRFDWVLRATVPLQQAGPVQTVILGGGDPAPFLALARDLAIPQPLVLATDDVGLYLSAADAYVSASATESFGLANLEALAAGLPSVCVAIPAVAEVMGSAAYLVAGEVDIISMALQEILSHPARAEHYSQAARDRATGWPDIEAIADRYVEMYQSVGH